MRAVRAGKIRASKLTPTAASAKKQEENHNEQDKTKSAAAIVANSGTHVVAATAKNKNKDHENEDQRHVAKSSTLPSVTRRKEAVGQPLPYRDEMPMVACGACGYYLAS
jgi:hypothetical protein